jgi:hypothetical protein
MKLLTSGSNSCESWEWEDLNEEVSIKGSFFKATVKNFGWQSLSGLTYVKANSFTQLLSSVLPNTECSFKIFKDGKKIVIDNSHHDKPCGGEIYTLVPCAKSTYLKNKR